MPNLTIYEKIRSAVCVIQEHTSLQPEIGMVLGSGLGGIADQVTDKVVIPYAEIPYFHGTSIEGHAGRLIFGKFMGVPMVFLQGRFHLYEGYPMEDVVFPTRTVCGLGIHTLVLTSAAGAVNPRFSSGDVMIIEDHINMMGDNPLRGPHLAQLGPRFPDLREAYSRTCIETLETVASELGIEVKTGVYVSLLGPIYETPAEVRMIKILGGDAVGMSTVPESIAANHLGVRVVGLSCIANLAAGLSPQKLTHKEVKENSRIGAEKIRQILEKAIPLLARSPVYPHSEKGTLKDPAHE